MFAMNPVKKLKTVFTAELALLAGLLTLYVIAAVSYIRYPGLHYDEMLYVNAALGGIDNSFIVERVGSVPIYLCTYMGALKAYLYYPIFALFEVSAMSVRLPMIMLTTASLYILFLTVKRAFGRKTAWIAFLLLISSPSIMAHTRTDNGPTAIQFFLTAICLYFIFTIYHTRRMVFLAVLYFICWVGIYNNIKFLWFINSIYFASLFLYLDTIYDRARSRDIGFFLKYLFAYAVSFLPFFIYTLIISRRITYPLVTKEYFGILKLKNIFNEIQGNGYYDFVLGSLSIPMGKTYLILVAVLLAAGTLMVFLSKSNNLLKKKLLFFWAIFLTTGLQILLTPQARKAWHAFKIYPWVSILLAVCILAAYGHLKKFNARCGKIFIISVLVLLIGYNTMVTGKYITAYRDKKSKPYWSEVVYDLIDYTRKENGRFFSCTWGIHNQLISFHQDPYRFQEIVLLLNRDMTEQEQEQFYTVYLKEYKTPHYFIVRPAKNHFYKKSRENLFKIAHKYGVKLIEHRRFHDTSDNQDIFIIYRIQNEAEETYTSKLHKLT